MAKSKIKALVTARSTWIRLVYILLFSVVFQIVGGLIAAIVTLQFLLLLLTGATNRRLAALGHDFGRYLGAIVAWLAFAEDDKPYPFGDWPGAGAAPATPAAKARTPRARKSRRRGAADTASSTPSAPAEPEAAAPAPAAPESPAASPPGPGPEPSAPETAPPEAPPPPGAGTEDDEEPPVWPGRTP